MSKYRPVLVYFDAEGYQNAEKSSKEKESLFSEALEWMSANSMNLIPPLSDNDLIEIHNSMTGFFTDFIYGTNKDKIMLDISKEKLLGLLDIDISKLAYIEGNYIGYEIEPQFNRGSITFPIDRKPFERYTKSAEENRKLRHYKAFIEALEDLSEHCHVYPFEIQKGTSGLVRFDRRLNKYFPNI